jgi:oligopeptide transport system substrate-binding protein
MLSGCDDKPFNTPYHGKTSSAYFSSFSEPPKTLDPAKSYSADEMVFIAQIYEPPLQYHYLLRPYRLVPLTATQMPQVRFWNQQGQLLNDQASEDQVAYTTYDIFIKPGIFYQPHPAFATDGRHHYLYHQLSSKIIASMHHLSDFKKSATRELIADDYIYQIKRLASPLNNSPIAGIMAAHIIGFSDFTKLITSVKNSPKKQKGETEFIDLRQYPLKGLERVDRYHYRIYVKGKYQQFIYWLAMPFFSPIPWEADRFYSQKGMDENNLSLDWYPVGTGPYQLAENNPNRIMRLVKNPHFHEEFFPIQGTLRDQQKEYLQNAGQRLPLTDEFIFTLEKETIPRWVKFLQGYYDQSAIAADSFDQAVQVDSAGNALLTPLLKDRGIRLQATVVPGVYYYGFNMLDKTVGGYTEQARKLRQAIAIALNMEEMINIFRNGRGVVAQGPIPPGVFGYKEGEAGINPYVYDWKNGQALRKPLEVAKKLMIEAGYPGGINKVTGKQLVINFDTVATSPDDKSMFDWLRKQLRPLGIELNVRGTLYNRFQDKVRQGSVQMFNFGWLADYPDPENFLFLFYGPDSKVKAGGENAVNYENPEFDKLYRQMRNLPNDESRQVIIDQMVALLQKDSPWVFGFFPKEFMLMHQWVDPRKPTAINNNILKYVKIDPQLRAIKQKQWNRPMIWPIVLLFILIVLLILPLWFGYRKRMNTSLKQLQ